MVFFGLSLANSMEVENVVVHILKYVLDFVFV